MLDWPSCNNEHKWSCSLKASILIREGSFYIYSGFILSYNVGITKTVVTKVKAYEPQPADTTVEDIMICPDDLKVSDWLGFGREHPKEKNEIMKGNFVRTYHIKG